MEGERRLRIAVRVGRGRAEKGRGGGEEAIPREKHGDPRIHRR